MFSFRVEDNGRAAVENVNVMEDVPRAGNLSIIRN
jgi:hypothetical protein